MKKKVIMILIIFYLFILIVYCKGNNKISTYMLHIYRNNDEPVVTCIFSFKDTNNNGIIETSELTELKETGIHAYPIYTGVQGDWRSSIDVKTLPKIDHSLEDVEEFNFNIAEFNKGKTIIKYRTKTKNKLSIEKYLFMRIVEIEENGNKISVLSWVGDGKQGLELTMLDSKKLTLKIEKK